MTARPGTPDSVPATPTESDRRHGLVIVNYGRNLLVETDDSDLVLCVPRRGVEALVCGDEVEWTVTADDAGVVEALLPRRNLLQRTDKYQRQRPLAANIDQVVIECAIEPPIEPFLVDKYTVATEHAGMTPLLVFNKSDLLDDAERARLEALAELYNAIGYTTLFTSAKENTGIDDFRIALGQGNSVLVGQSGVGKSSLIKRLLPEQDIAIGRLSEASGQGRHTTTATTLYHLPGGGNLLDSPGVRDFRPGEFTPEQLADGFREFRPHLGQCRFNDCLHKGEPGCAVTEACEQGRISRQRMDSYRRML